MPNSSILSCIRIRVHAVPGRTDAFLSALQEFAQLLPNHPESFSYAELHLSADSREHDCFWMEGDCPEFDSGLIISAKEIDLRMNLCCEDNLLPAAQDQLFDLLADGALSDCVRFCALVTDDEHASLLLSGMRNGAFHHGEVPFVDGCDGVPEDMCWNSSTHRAQFIFPEEALDDAWDLSEIIPEHIDEIDLEFSFDRGEMQIHSVQLPDMDAVGYYLNALNWLAKLASNVSISGALTPESDSAFALLRFACNGGVTVQTALAEIQ